MQAVAVDRLVGQTLGNCRVEQLLGKGRLSAVYLAQQPDRQSPVAVTTFLIPETLSAQARERFLARFQREAAALVSLHHPNILPVYAYGEQYGYPYLVTPYATDGSLATLLKQQGRCTPTDLIDMVEQVSSALDYAHSHGVIHGTLKPANVLFTGEQRLQVAGFNLVRILEMRGIEQSASPYAQLLNVAGTFLGSPEYIAPECVQGQSADARSDIYAFGIMLFELLSGQPPFTGSNPIETAMQHIQPPLPSLHTLCPDVSPALEAVVNRALARDPAQRIQSAQDLAVAFIQVVTSEQSSYIASTASATNTDAALPVRTPLFRKTTLTRKSQFVPPVMTGHLPSIPAAPASSTQPAPAPAQVTGSLPVPLVKPILDPAHAARLTDASVLSSQDVDAMAVDPFEWWTKTFTGHLPAQGLSALPNTQGSLGAVGTYGPPRRPRSRKQSMTRRQVVATIAGGGLVVGVLGFGGVSLAHMLQGRTHLTTASVGPATVTKTGTTPAPGTTPTQGQAQAAGTPTPGQAKPTPKATAGAQPTATATHAPNATATSPTTQATPTPTQTQPTPTPTQTQPTPTPTPSHTGTVIGSTSQGTNTSKGFSNPNDGRGSLLIHLPNGNFVAYESACTHAGVPVNYDSGSHQLVCPAHGARFDPANGGSVLQGPANSPLRGVTIHVNGDGTITA